MKVTSVRSCCCTFLLHRTETPVGGNAAVLKRQREVAISRANPQPSEGIMMAMLLFSNDSNGSVPKCSPSPVARNQCFGARAAGGPMTHVCLAAW